MGLRGRGLPTTDKVPAFQGSPSSKLSTRKNKIGEKRIPELQVCAQPSPPWSLRRREKGIM